MRVPLYFSSLSLLHTALHYLNAWNRLQSGWPAVRVACSKRSDSGERCGVPGLKKQQQSRIFFRLNFDVYVVVQFYPCMVMHDNEFQTKENNLNKERLPFVRKFR